MKLNCLLLLVFYSKTNNTIYSRPHHSSNDILKELITFKFFKEPYSLERELIEYNFKLIITCHYSFDINGLGKKTRMLHAHP